MGSAEVQGELWGRHPQTWAKFQESQMRPLYDATLEALEPLADRALLDAGCGAGLALRLAADRGAVVSGLDASAPLLEVVEGAFDDVAAPVGDGVEVDRSPAACAALPAVADLNRPGVSRVSGLTGAVQMMHGTRSLRTSPTI